MQPQQLEPTVNFTPEEQVLEVFRCFLREVGVTESSIVGGLLELRGFIRGRLGLF